MIADAVFLALRAAELRGEHVSSEFHREREALYARHSAEHRDKFFAAHDAEWFRRMRLTDPILRALACVPRVSAGVDVLLVRRALRSRDEGSELYRDDGVRLVLTLLPLRFANPAQLFEIALRELLYCDDMLDPRFGFAPELAPGAELEPARAELVRDRFRVLWEARVRARTARAGADVGPLDVVPSRFARAFAAASSETQADLWRDATSGRLSTAGALWSCALDPRSRAPLDASATGEGLR